MVVSEFQVFIKSTSKSFVQGFKLYSSMLAGLKFSFVFRSNKHVIYNNYYCLNFYRYLYAYETINLSSSDQTLEVSECVCEYHL